MTQPTDDILIPEYATTRKELRKISTEAIVTVLNEGRVIEALDKGRLLSVAYPNQRALHVIWVPDGGKRVVVTTYWPDETPELWNEDFTERRKGNPS